MTRRAELQHLELRFKNTLKKCAGKPNECKLFMMVYSNLVDAVEEFYSANIKNPIICVGFNQAYQKMFNKLLSLERSLINRKII
ncbi:hypothetical protein M3201_24390 [Paenibacillus motobuensis]|uniref:hypothetical protein n=1 Tax=Paenibacillus TaxID=44249 RepID=UPI00203B978E|nr:MULTISPECIES: hypothetical protein [Paenibacillus]MCM3042801.1 hypothetical protein [Paenibacillus lutimineralis]MCM3649905.1 hypothetical protein [Paenibacillus motobuensis]